MTLTRSRLVVTGIVQGVGFRPAVHRLARSLGLSGFVGNDATGVFIEVEGAADVIERFVEELPARSPPLAVIEMVSVAAVQPVGDSDFLIVDSVASGDVNTFVLPDVAPCGACLRELGDPADRRYGYPFLNCTNCGPRYSIVRELPYDRPMTTMALFEMCSECAAEYHDPSDRRFHAQPTCCDVCGPHLDLRDAAFEPVDGPGDEAAVIDAVARRLRTGEIVALKGLGGYHLAVDASNEPAVARLRSRKQREEKPFAVMARDVDAARRLASVGAVEADLLLSPERPIVLLTRHGDDGFAASVAPGNRSVGVMLPPTPLHVLIAERFDGPLVMTSANRSNEPIVFRDDEVLAGLGGIADAFCIHDRPIHVRVDDSVVRVIGDRGVVHRRARGHAPRPVRVPGGFPRHTLAVGAQLKNTVCVGRDDHAVVSQHLGDLENYETFAAFEEAIEHLCHLFDIRPEVVAHDLHPELMSTSYARALTGVEIVAVQHHHAHIAACLADNEHDGAVIGVAFDGLGFGTDNTIWGGEILRADLASFERLGHLAPVPMPGGDQAVRQPWRMAAVQLSRALGIAEARAFEVFSRHGDSWDAVMSMASAGVSSPLTSSMGRLFDAVAAIVGVRDEVTYEGQAAIELEQIAEYGDHAGYPVEFADGSPFVIDPAPLIRSVAEDLAAGLEVGVMAARFHQAVVDLIVASCSRARSTTSVTTVALSGGVFQNARLVESATGALEAEGFDVLTHRRFPCNDGGISLGQAAVVAALDRSG